ncbi:MAG: acyl-[acyl-carrier-protein] thioesterase [Saccharofermentanales bacterium]
MSENFSRQYEYTVRSTETDIHDELQLFSLLSMLQEAASIDADISGLGASCLDSKGLCWVLLRTSIRLFAIPKWQDRITIDTWTNGVERLFSIRDFIITDQNKRLLGKATTSWLVADKITHHPQKITALENELVFKTSISALGFSSPKLDETMACLPSSPILTRNVGFSDIDRNMHANNTRYAAWCLDAIGKKGIPSANLAGIDINYVTEAKLGEDIDLYLSDMPVNKSFNPDAKTASLILGKHREENKTAFIAIIYWDSDL